MASVEFAAKGPDSMSALDAEQWRRSTWCLGRCSVQGLVVGVIEAGAANRGALGLLGLTG
jgi:hypothetical protein